MSRIEAAFEKLSQQAYAHAPWHRAACAYIASGDRGQLSKVKAGANVWAFHGLEGALAHPPAWGDEDRRALQVLGVARLDAVLERWISAVLAGEAAADDRFGAIRAELEAAGLDEPAVAQIALLCGEALERDGRPTSLGRFVVSLSDRVLREALAAAVMDDERAGEVPHALGLLLGAAPDRVAGLLPAVLRGHTRGWTLPPVCACLLERGGGRHEQVVLETFRAEENPNIRFRIGLALDRLAPDRHGAEVLAAARASLAAPAEENDHPSVVEWMLRRFSDDTTAEVVAYVARPGPRYAISRSLTAARDALGAGAAPILLAAVEHAEEALRIEALDHLIALGGHDEEVRAGVASGLGGDKGEAVLRYLQLAARVGAPELAQRIWALLGHASKPVRDAAARALGRLGEPAVAPAVEQLGARKATTRLAAVTILAIVATPAALAALEARLDVEEDEGVRDAIYRGLAGAWKAAGRAFTAADVEARIARAAQHLAASPAAWVDLSRAPAPRDADGRKLSEREVRYLVYRQARAKEMAPDVEAEPLLARVRGRGGELALELVRQYLASGADAADRWALCLAALLGDDRLVPLLAPKVREWADASRGKLAEYGVQALALLGTDEALVAVDALALRYRVKNKNVGRAAVEAFAAAAEARGLTPDELGDKVVPWLGFPREGGPRVVEAGAKRIEVTIGPDLKLAFRDAATGKRAASLPRTVGEEARIELKELAASLRELAKAQVLRLENLMVRQRRWPVAEWSAMFLRHPLLAPFAVRLVWAAHGPDGRRGVTFRALEDRTLTDAADGLVELPGEGAVGAVHPLELSEEERRAWATHLADHEVSPPFPQLERPVVRVEASSREARSSAAVRGTSLNGLTFRGRAEKLGWHRGSVIDGGGISSYRKTFPAAGADAFLDVEGMFMGMGMDDSVQLGTLRFVRGGSVQVGSYTYDEPSEDADPRVLPFGEVPPIVFSEVMGDLQRIAGTAAGTGEEAGGEG